MNMASTANVNPRWTTRLETGQGAASEGEFFKRDTLMFNGDSDSGRSLYNGMDRRNISDPHFAMRQNY